MSRKFEEMEARLRGFERELGRVNDRESMKSAAGNPSPRDRYAATVQDIDESIHPNVVPDISVSEQYGTDVLIETPMNTMGVLAFADEQVSGFFGKSPCSIQKSSGQEELIVTRPFFQHRSHPTHI